MSEFDDADDWDDGPAEGGWEDCPAEPMEEEEPAELSPEERLQNTLWEAEQEEKENPQKALQLYLEYLEESPAVLSSYGPNSTAALDMQSAMKRARVSTVRVACRLGEMGAAKRELQNLVEELRGAGWEDGECVLLLKLLSDCQEQSGEAAMGFVEELYRLALSAAPAPVHASSGSPRRARLWFDLRAGLAKLLLHEGKVGAVRALLDEMRPLASAPQQVQLLALDYSCAKESNEAKTVSALLDRAEELLADKTLPQEEVDVFSAALLRKALADRHLTAQRFTEAFRHYSKAYLGFYQLHATAHAIPCLKGAILTQLLTKRKSVFYTHQFKENAGHKDVKALAALAEAFELQVDYKYKKAVKELEPALTADPFVAPFFPLLAQLAPDDEPTEEVYSIYRQVDSKTVQGLECSVCLDPFGDAPHRKNFKDEPQIGPDGKIAFPRAVRLFRCDGHYFHKHCVMEWVAQHQTCPVCSRFYGSGQQPAGSVTISRSGQSLPGFPGCGTLELTFDFPAGTTGESHPEPGKPHPAFRKRALLPANAEGQAAAAMLRTALERRVLFRLERQAGSGQFELVPEVPLKTTPAQFTDADAGRQYLEVLTEALQRRGVR